MGAGQPTERAIVVTGAASGIGRATAERLAAAGHRVYGGDIRLDAAPFSSPVHLSHLDVDDDESCQSFVRGVLGDAGRIDVLFNNAGFGIAGAAEETSMEEARAQVETLFFGTARMCREVLLPMREAGGGLIVNMSSIGGLIALPFQAFYSAAKFAVEGYTEALRFEVAPFGIDVVLVEPSDIRTPFTDRRRVVVGTSDDSPYRERFRAVLDRAEADERGGSDPEQVARLIERIVGARRHRLRYTVGDPAIRATPVLKRILPGPLAESLVRAYWSRS